LRTDIDGLDEAIKNELENWSNGELRRAVNESLEGTPPDAAGRVGGGAALTGKERENIPRTGRTTKGAAGQALLPD